MKIVWLRDVVWLVVGSDKAHPNLLSYREAIIISSTNYGFSSAAFPPNQALVIVVLKY